jgi:hypothetical protein
MAKSSAEKTKIIALSGLGGILLLVLVYQLFFSSSPPRPTIQANKNAVQANSKGGATTQNSGSTEKAVSKPTGHSNPQEDMMAALLEDTSPLNPHMIRTGGSAAVSSRGNIFDYYVEPPKPPPPPPPPPPITLQGVSPQSATAGTPRPFTLTVYGRNFPPDAKIFMDGNPRNTKRVNDTTLATEMAPTDYAFARTSTIEVKSPTEPAKWYSGQVTFTSVPAPEPPFKFIGLLGDQALFEMTGSKEYLRLRVGATIQGVWRIDSISLQAVELTHLQFSIKKRVPLQEKPR